MTNFIKIIILLILIYPLNLNAWLDGCFAKNLDNISIKKSKLKPCLLIDLSSNCGWQIILKINSRCINSYYVYNEDNTKEWKIISKKTSNYKNYIRLHETEDKKFIKKLVNTNNPEDIIYLTLWKPINFIQISWYIFLIILISWLIFLFLWKIRKKETKKD